MATHPTWDDLEQTKWRFLPPTKSYKGGQRIDAVEVSDLGIRKLTSDGAPYRPKLLKCAFIENSEALEVWRLRHPYANFWPQLFNTVEHHYLRSEKGVMTKCSALEYDHEFLEDEQEEKRNDTA